MPSGTIELQKVGEVPSSSSLVANGCGLWTAAPDARPAKAELAGPGARVE
jgi:hypothetical protein